jgi:hypothetical protein
MSEYDDRMKNFRGSLRQWQRIRHPWAGGVRVALLAALPFVIWSHNPLASVIWIAAALFHPALFPAYVVAGSEAPILTRLTDTAEHWYEMTAPKERKLDIFPCAVMVLPAFCSLWLHILFWGMYFYLAAIGCAAISFRRQMHLIEEIEHQKTAQREHAEHIHPEEIEHA